MTLIYLEGPDGAGKSMLANELVKLTADAVYLHDTYADDLPGGQFKHSTDLLHRAVQEHHRGKLVVLDRGWMGDNIYHSCFRPGRQNHWPRWHHGIMQKVGALTIMCVPGNRDQFISDFNADRLRNGKKEMYDTMEQVYDRYLHVMLGYPNDPHQDYVGLLARTGGLLRRPEYVCYDRYHYPGSRVVQAARQFYETAKVWQLETSYQVPSTTAHGFSGVIDHDTTLFVTGELEPSSTWTIPMLAQNEMSDFFARCLTRAGARQDRLALVTGNYNGAIWILRQALRLGPKRVVALGPEALELVIQASGQPPPKSVGMLTHPRDWPRGPEDEADYTRLLEELL